MGVVKVDTIIANAGKFVDFAPALEVKSETLRDLFQVNDIAPLLLFQAFKSLLDASKNPKFVALPSSAGSIAAQIELPMRVTSYGGTKAALNHSTYSSRELRNHYFCYATWNACYRYGRYCNQGSGIQN